MKPIYFPFTHISPKIFQALSACFKQTVVYQPSSRKVPEKMEAWRKSGGLDIRIPVAGNEKEIDAILKDYRAWVNLHQGSEIAFLKTQADKIPLFDETSTRQIMADIKNQGDWQNRSQKKPEPLFEARLFLHVAQELDLQNDELSRDFQAIEAMEKDFMKDLKGENETSPGVPVENRTLESGDPGHYMTKERIHAWTHLMQHDQQASGLFITTSKSVLEDLIDIAPEIEILIGLDAIPILDNRVAEIERWQDGLMQSLDTLAVNAWPASTDGFVKAPAVTGCDRKVSLTLYIVPGETQYEFFNRYVEHDIFNNKEKYQRVKLKNTLLGLIEKSS